MSQGEQSLTHDLSKQTNLWKDSLLKGAYIRGCFLILFLWNSSQVLFIWHLMNSSAQWSGCSRLGTPYNQRSDSRIISVHGSCGMIDKLIIIGQGFIYIFIRMVYLCYLLKLIPFINIVISSLRPYLLPVAYLLGEKLYFAAAHTTFPRPGIMERAPILTPKTRFRGSFKTLHMYMSLYVHAQCRSHLPTDFVLFGISVLNGLLQMENHSLVSKTTIFFVVICNEP